MNPLSKSSNVRTLLTRIKSCTQCINNLIVLVHWSPKTTPPAFNGCFAYDLSRSYMSRSVRPFMSLSSAISERKYFWSFFLAKPIHMKARPIILTSIISSLESNLSWCSTSASVSAFPGSTLVSVSLGLYESSFGHSPYMNVEASCSSTTALGCFLVLAIVVLYVFCVCWKWNC